MQVEEFTPRMRPAPQLDAGQSGCGKQDFVPGIIVDQQMSLPVLQKVPCMPATTADLIVEDDDARSGLKIIAAIGPQVSFAGFASTRIELCHRRFIHMQRAALQQVPGQTIRQRLQGKTDAACPFDQGETGQGYLFASGKLR